MAQNKKTPDFVSIADGKKMEMNIYFTDLNAFMNNDFPDIEDCLNNETPDVEIEWKVKWLHPKYFKPVIEDMLSDVLDDPYFGGKDSKKSQKLVRKIVDGMGRPDNDAYIQYHGDGYNK